MTSPDPRQDLVGRAVEELVAWARRLDSHRSFPFEGVDLSRSQMEVLFLIAHADPPPTPGRLAEALGVTPGAVTQLVAGLTATGLVDQRRDPSDARRRVLVLTEGSRAQVRDFERGVVRWLAPHFSDLNDEELTTLAALLARTRRHA